MIRERRDMYALLHIPSGKMLSKSWGTTHIDAYFPVMKKKMAGAWFVGLDWENVLKRDLEFLGLGVTSWTKVRPEEFEIVYLGEFDVIPGW